ncbi:DUF6653 family protein [Natrononativus amylolyticus]|uniref:DUF6653 family protein n=1 Tax=Natrononativus amylolyticus TaxID=2963434 RepID=UPI0020CB6BCA|nr:DUF6653 family protein [Natrononativus amylolyticus]
MASAVPDEGDEWFWRRHSNPKSVWTRILLAPAIAYAIYRRSWRLLVLSILWGVVNPIVFSPPKDEEAWMTRGVLAQQWWVREEGHGILGVSKPNIFSTAAVLTSIYTLYAAWRQRPLKTALGTILTVVLKFWWLRHLVDRYDRRVK